VHLSCIFFVLRNNAAWARFIRKKIKKPSGKEELVKQNEGWGE
jgi:hypothetical protein